MFKEFKSFGSSSFASHVRGPDFLNISFHIFETNEQNKKQILFRNIDTIVSFREPVQLTEIHKDGGTPLSSGQ